MNCTLKDIKPADYTNKLYQFNFFNLNPYLSNIYTLKKASITDAFFIKDISCL